MRTIECKNSREWFSAAVPYDDEVLVIFKGARSYYKGGLLHRDGGAAVEGTTYDKWMKNGKSHRTDGPYLTRYVTKKKKVIKHRAWAINGKVFNSIELWLKELSREDLELAIMNCENF